MDENKEKRYSDLITTKRMILFSLIAPVAGLLSGMWGNLQFYSASALLIPLPAIAFIFLVYSIVDAFNDPIVGYLTDRSTKFTTKLGKRYPFIVIGVIFSPIFLLLCFIHVSDNLIIQIIWLSIFMAIYETFLTIHEVCQKSLYPDMFREEKDRRKVSAIGAIIGGITLILGALFIPLMIGAFGGATNPNAFLFTCIVIVIVVYILTIPYLRGGVKETKKMREFRARLDESGKNTSPLKDVLRRIFKDRNWMALVIAFLLWASGGLCIVNGLNFFLVYYLELPIELVAIPGIVYAAVAFTFAPLWMKVVKKFGVKKTYMTSLFLNSLVFLLFFFVRDLLGMTLVLALIGIFAGANLGVVFELAQAEAIDNAAVYSGKREEGTYIGVFRVFSAFSLFFQTLIFSIVGGGIFGFDPALGKQTELAKLGLSYQMSVIPFVLSLVAAVIFSLSYKITKEQAKENAQKLMEMGL
jgi:GPH family glycoside/pentoside/hexuronide:cation symporter